MRRIAFIDFEASCLPDEGNSFPIELAIAEVCGASRSWLIKPAPAWRYWDWSDKAEALHGLSRTMLQERGRPVEEVLAEVAALAHGTTVYADSDLDAYWLETLSAAAGAPPPFPVLYVGELFQQMALDHAAIEKAQRTAFARLPREHIARHDARRLALTVEQIGRHRRHRQLAATGVLASAALCSALALGRGWGRRTQ